MATVQNESQVLRLGGEFHKELMQFGAADIEDLALGIARIERHDRLIQAGRLFTGGVDHLGSVAAVVEHDNVAGLRFCDEMVLDGLKYSRVSRLFVLEHQHILWREIELPDEHGLHRFDIVDGAVEGGDYGRVFVLADPYEKSPLRRLTGSRGRDL